MRKRQLSRSDLARVVFGEIEEDGRLVAKNRQAVGRWISGENAPTEDNRFKIAEALDVPYDRLFRDDPVNRPGSGIVLSVDGGEAEIEISLVVPVDLAVEIVGLLKPHAR